MDEYGFADVVYDFPEPQITWVKKDINALVLESQKKDRVNVVISTGTKMLSEIMPEVAEDKAYTFISVKGGFSSINFIVYIISNLCRKSFIKVIFCNIYDPFINISIS